MDFKALFVVAVAAISTAQGCAQCPYAQQCLPPPSPYDGLAAVLALPPPVFPPLPALPPYLPPSAILPGCGPPPSPILVIQAPPMTIPGPESPVIPLPSPPLPPPQLIAHKCVVSKAVEKPQVFQRLVLVPSLARFLKKSVAPVLENIAYTATPKCAGPEAPVSYLPAPAPAPAAGVLPPPAPPCLPPLPPPALPCLPPLPPPCGCKWY